MDSGAESANWALGFSWGILVLLGALFTLAIGVIAFLRHVIRAQDALLASQGTPAAGENLDLDDALADGGESANV